MAGPFDSLLAEKQPAGPFGGLLGESAKKSQAGPFGSLLATDKTAELEQKAEESGAPAIPQDSPGLAARVMDLIQRPNYAIAGAAEEAFVNPANVGPTAKVQAALGRAGRELISGVPGIQGEKRAFGEVLEGAGVPELGHVNVPNPLYPIYRAADMRLTGRGALGLGLDIATDPTTYVTLGESSAVKTAAELGGRALSGKGIKMLGKEMLSGATREVAEKSVLEAAVKDVSLLDRGGLKFAGQTVPGTPVAAAAIRAKAAGMSKGLAETVAKLPGGQKVLDSASKVADSLDYVFHRDIYGKEVPGYLKDKQAFLDSHAVIEADLKDQAREGLKPIQTRGARKQFKGMIDAYQKGGLDALTGTQRQAMEQFGLLTKQMAEDEVRRGLLSPDAIVENYVPQFYENSREEMERVLSAWKPSVLNKASIGRHSEARAFESYAQAVEVSTRLHAIDPHIPILRPIYDPYVVLGKRIEAHATAVAFDDFYKTVGKKYGTEFTPGNYFDLTREQWPGKLSARQVREYQAITKQVARPHKPEEFLTRLTPEGKQEFLRQRFSRAKTRAALLSDMEKFSAHAESFPKAGPLVGQLAADGTVYKRITGIPSLAEFDLPGGIAMDLDHIAKSYQSWAPRELEPFIRGFDRANNWFKSGVTALFPAFHARNLYSNVAQAFADIGISAIHPALHADTIGILAGEKGTFKTWLGQSYDYDAIREMLKQHQVRVSGRQALEFTGEAPIRAGVSGKLAATTGAIETEARAQLFLNYLRRGARPEDAAARVKEVLFDYGNLSETERRVMRRIIPFYTWTRKNITRQVDNLIRRPGLTATEVKAFSGRSSENQQLTSWDGQSLKLRLDRDGKNLTVLMGVDLPIKDLDRIWAGDARTTLRQNLGMLTPAFKTPIEVAGGRSLFTGKDLSRQESAGIGRIAEQMPKPVQQWLGYRKDVDAAGRPRYTFNGERFYMLFQSWLVSRLVSTTDKQFKSYSSDPRMAPIMLNALTGLQYKTLNLDEEQARRLKERERQLHEALVKQGEEYSGTHYGRPKPR